MNDTNKLLTKLAHDLEDKGAHDEAEEVLKLLEEEPEVKADESKVRVNIDESETDVKGEDIHRINVAVEGGSKQEVLEGIQEALTDIADKLDAAGATKEADAIDEMIHKFAADVKWQKEDSSTLQSHRYDSEHNNEQTFKHNKPVKQKETQHHNPSSQEIGDKVLSMRYCPIHCGVMVHRVGEGSYMCDLDGAIYNWEAGWTDSNGKHPGGSISNQTEQATNVPIPSRVFDPREDVINRIN